MVQISPSLLSADLSCLKEEVQALEKAAADRLHFDIMDNHYVPNLTFGPNLIKALRPYTSLPFEVHLMASPVDQLLESVCQAGADIVIVHPDATIHLHRTLQLIKDEGKKAGVALNPATSPEFLLYILDMIDQVLVMTVNPGFGGQDFLDHQLVKIRTVHDMIKGKTIELAVDGGICAHTASYCIEAGANVLVAGTAVFKDAHYAYNIQQLRQAA